MPTHSEQKYLPYSPVQMFDLVLDVEKYGQFLPWCIACRKKTEGDEFFEADLIIGYKFIREKFKSRVVYHAPDLIEVEYIDGPMKNLKNHWKFIQDEKTSGCIIDFHVEFEFSNPMLQGIITMFFDKAVTKMVDAFEQRAAKLYKPCK